jgi:subtilisin family serine protease
VGSDTLAAPHALARVDRDVVSRFATCCRALGLSVHDRQRPADLTAARTGFAGLTRIAHEQCDAWTGLAAAGEVDTHVVEAIWRTLPSAGVLQRQIGLAPRTLGFTYDTGLYLQFRTTDPDDFQLAYAATLSDADKYADADRVVLPGTDTRAVSPNRLSLNLNGAWQHSRGDSQTVAVIDTGVQPGPRLPNVEAGGDFVESTDGLTDCDGHGTLVAGLIAGQPGETVSPGWRRERD